MDINAPDLANKISLMTNKDLLVIVRDDRELYNKETIELAIEELDSRGIEITQNAANAFINNSHLEQSTSRIGLDGTSGEDNDDSLVHIKTYGKSA